MRFAQLRQSLVDPAPRAISDIDRRPRGQRTAAVLVLCTDEHDPRITFVRRASTLRNHAGQVAFPGGRMDPCDAGVVDTALREAWEEVGVERSQVEILGQLPAVWVPKSNFDVNTVVARWSGGVLTAMDPRETASVHQVQISRLASSEVRRTAAHPRGHRGPAFVLPEGFIWGLTAYLLDWILELGGWSEDWDREHVVPIPAEYLRD